MPSGLPTPGLFITANEITRGKPDPEPYLKGAAGLGFAPEQCIVVEDALAGIASGRNAGARVIAFHYHGVHHRSGRREALTGY